MVRRSPCRCLHFQHNISIVLNLIFSDYGVVFLPRVDEENQKCIELLFLCKIDVFQQGQHGEPRIWNAEVCL